ncbi:MAG: restriction endonuclease [Gammaproteobacteria bacterium]|nr:restriction endonuclease [Gammaproteobacteria bacterium]MYG65115.1 restriction endonuclease [Gammaproteobacteria bacterium]
MKRGQLRDHFVGAGVKRLSGVDAEPEKSNQHEVNTTREMRDRFLGEIHEQKYPVRYIWLGGDREGFSVEGTATHYDARKNIDGRSEWRLYYPSNAVTEAMRGGDTLFLAKHNDGQLYFIVAPEGSTSEHQLLWLFGVAPKGKSFVSREFPEDGPELDFAARYILDEIGIETEDPDADGLGEIIDPLPLAFPSTANFSRLARDTLPDVRAEDDPDVALLMWLIREEALFRRLEKRIVSKRLEEGFDNEEGVDVDGFIDYSLSVHNRRKSRMGHSLENHLEAVFRAFGIAYDRGKITENNHRPDFLFPSVTAYHAAPATGATNLAMLGAKSSCKERWRQVLAEADKIPRKHLLTLEPGISEPQTDQMEASNLQLVVPRDILGSYTEVQRVWLWNLRDFIGHLKRGR